MQLAAKILFVFSVLLGLVTMKAPVTIDLSNSNFPILQTWEHPLGCDRLGRDVYALYAYGSFTTFLISIPARLVTILFSVSISFIYYTSGKFLDFLIDSFASVFLSLPSFFGATGGAFLTILTSFSLKSSSKFTGIYALAKRAESLI